jgi:hypothetical protein
MLVLVARSIVMNRKIGSEFRHFIAAGVRWMKKEHEQDLSGAYGDRDETLSRPGLMLVIAYSLTIGWIWILARFIWLWATAPRWSPHVTYAAHWRRFIRR